MLEITTGGGWAKLKFHNSRRIATMVLSVFGAEYLNDAKVSSRLYTSYTKRENDLRDREIFVISFYDKYNRS
jgi:hypothetical protein